MARAILTGTTGSPGVAAGRLLWVPGGAHPAVRAPAPASPSTARDAAAEEARLLAALEGAAEELEVLARECSTRAGDEVGAIFEAQAMFARDPGIVDAAVAAVRDGADAVGAIEAAAASQAEILAALDDDYLRERAADVRDVGRRVVGRLTGQPPPTVHHADGTPAIVAGEDLDPSVVAVVRPELVAGLVMAGGAANGHAAIVARALGIPLLLGLGTMLDASLDNLDSLIDGPGGRLLVEPDAADRRAVEDAASPAPAAPPSGLATGAGPHALPARVEANVGSVREAEQAAAAGAEGIGLVRTELLFLGRSVPPGVDEQRALYGRIRAAMPSGPVIFRTLDIGGDKPAAWSGTDPELNPALGTRGVRLGLRRRELLETQLRAIVESAPGGTAHVLLPMVSVVDEVIAARAILDDVLEQAGTDGRPVATDVRVGIMIEIPSAALTAASFAQHVDFFSIGTNDLVQYTMAVDRTNPALAELATTFQPAVLRLVRAVTEAAAPRSLPVAVCGEAAADPVAAALFVGLGVTELSVAPSSVAPLRTVLARLDVDACRAAASQALDAPSAEVVRAIGEGLVDTAADLGDPVPASVGGSSRD